MHIMRELPSSLQRRAPRVQTGAQEESLHMGVPSSVTQKGSGSSQATVTQLVQRLSPMMQLSMVSPEDWQRATPSVQTSVQPPVQPVVLKVHRSVHSRTPPVKPRNSHEAPPRLGASHSSPSC